jgi:hypothetical protein
VTDGELLDEIVRGIAGARRRIELAETGDQPWTSIGEETLARFIVDWGERMLGRLERGETTLAQLREIRAAVERARTAETN